MAQTELGYTELIRSSSLAVLICIHLSLVLSRLELASLMPVYDDSGSSTTVITGFPLLVFRISMLTQCPPMSVSLSARFDAVSAITPAPPCLNNGFSVNPGGRLPLQATLE